MLKIRLNQGVTAWLKCTAVTTLQGGNRSLFSSRSRIRYEGSRAFVGVKLASLEVVSVTMQNAIGSSLT